MKILFLPPILVHEFSTQNYPTAVSPVLQARLHGSEYQMVKLGGQAKNFDSDLILGSGLFYRLGKILKYSLHSMVESPSY